MQAMSACNASYWRQRMCLSGHGDSRSVNKASATRRDVALLSAPASLLTAALQLAAPPNALAGVLSDTWQAIGGGPPDLYFPDEFLGTWTVRSTLASVETPLGEDYVPDMTSISRARQQDLNKTLTYPVTFTRNAAGRVVLDRRSNTADLVAQDPYVLTLRLPRGGDVETRVTRRLQESPEPRRIDTSEYLRQVFTAEDGGGARVTASQCFTKYKWRSEAEAAASAQRNGGAGASAPRIVATQVVSNYLTAMDGEARLVQSMGKAVSVFTYRMQFYRI
eukprot:jgi/Ulvmu1/3473/UM016_0093.1